MAVAAVARPERTEALTQGLQRAASRTRQRVLPEVFERERPRAATCEEVGWARGVEQDLWASSTVSYRGAADAEAFAETAPAAVDYRLVYP